MPRRTTSPESKTPKLSFRNKALQRVADLLLLPSFKRTVEIQLSILLILVAITYHGVILQIQASNYGISTVGVGVISSFFYVGWFVSCVLSKNLIARLGHIRGHAMMSTCYALATLLFPILPNLPAWSVLYFVCGWAVGGMFVVFETWLNFSTDNKGRGNVMAVYLIMVTAGKIVGYYTFNYISSFSFSHYSYIAMFILVSMLPLLTTARQQPQYESGEFWSIKAIYRISPAAFVVLILSQMGTASMNGLGAIVGQMMGFNNWYISHFMSLIFVSSIIIQVPLGKTTMDRRLVMLFSVVILMIGCAMFFFSSLNSLVFWLSIILIGSTMSGLYPLALAHINDLLDEKYRTVITSQLLLVGAVGLAAGPITTSFFIDYFGYHGFPLALFVIFGAILLFLLLRLQVRRPQGLGESTRINFIPDVPLAPSVAQPTVNLKSPTPEPPKTKDIEEIIEKKQG